MYAAVAPPSALNEGVTVHKDPDSTAKGRVTQSNLDRIRQARAKNQVLSQKLAKDVSKKPRGIISSINYYFFIMLFICTISISHNNVQNEYVYINSMKPTHNKQQLI